MGCGGHPPPAPERVTPGPPEIGELSTLIPADATLVAVVEPARLLAHEPTAHVVSALFSDSQLDRFTTRTGVDPRSLADLVIAMHPAGRIAIARGPIDAEFAVLEAGERMAPVESSVDGPIIRRAGFLGASRVEVVALAADTVLYIEGSPQLAASVLASARRHESTRDSALADLTFPEHEQAPLVIYGPHPLDMPTETGIGMLLARERTMAVSVRPEETGLGLRAEFRGEFPPEAHENFRAFAESIAASELGAALGAADALPTLRIQADERGVVLTAVVDPSALASGLRAIFVAEIEELIEGAPHADLP